MTLDKLLRWICLCICNNEQIIIGVSHLLVRKPILRKYHKRRWHYIWFQHKLHSILICIAKPIAIRLKSFESILLVSNCWNLKSINGEKKMKRSVAKLVEDFPQQFLFLSKSTIYLQCFFCCCFWDEKNVQTKMWNFKIWAIFAWIFA